MATAASPTPMGHGSNFSTGRRTSARQALRRPTSRPQLSRSGSTPIVSGAAIPSRRDSNKAQSQQISTLNDSSDDEIPVPMKLSALTKALLNDGSSAAGQPANHAAAETAPAAAVPTRRRSALSRSTNSATGDKDTDVPRTRQTRRHIRSGSVQISSSRPTSPVRSETSPAPAARKRVVRLSSTTTPAGGVPPGQLRTSLSASKHARRPPSRERTEEKMQAHSQPAAVEPQPPVVNTPSGSVRRVHIVVGSSGGGKGRLSSSSAGLSSKRSGSGQPSDHEGAEDPATAPRPHGSVSRLGTSTRAKEPEPAPQSSMRVKRVGKVPGSFLSGPARRGRRRQSEEDEENSPLDENGEVEALLASQVPESQAHELDHVGSSFYQPYVPDFAASGSPVSARDPARAALRRHSPPDERLPSPKGILVDRLVNPPPMKPVIIRPELPSTHDKENEDPYRVKPYQKPLIPDLDFQKPVVHRVDVDIPSSVVRQPSPERKVLAAVSRNTPHRPAPPPPPKMSALETATAPGGAAAAKKSRILLKVGGKAYSKLDCIGRGGSGKVYKVTAENGKIYALKRVPFDGADDSTVRGFQGEIDLLRKLSGVERVIQIIDHEINNEKKMLSVLMEMGELDFNTLLKTRQGQEGAKLDTVSVRFYWKEMLECLQAVHAHNIVHSDLKPANFVLVQGRLKLIDFGIANAIQTDQTVNVHRETQIGTPNYMSPESLMDSQQYAYISTNNGRLGMPHGRGGPKLMKLGKPSDVWSLGCILYQLVYGQPPFGMIQNQLARCQAIINWNHPIDFPERGIGGVVVPLSLVRTMRKCLNREQHQRPTCEQLLSESDPFLYPQENAFAGLDGNNLPINEEMMKRIISSVVHRCRDRMPTEGEVLSTWPAAYWASIRKAVTATTDGRAPA